MERHGLVAASPGLLRRAAEPETGRGAPRRGASQGATATAAEIRGGRVGVTATPCAGHAAVKLNVRHVGHAGLFGKTVAGAGLHVIRAVRRIAMPRRHPIRRPEGTLLAPAIVALTSPQPPAKTPGALGGAAPLHFEARTARSARRTSMWRHKGGTPTTTMKKSSARGMAV